MNILQSEEVREEDGSKATHFLNAAHPNDLADVPTPAEVSITEAEAADLSSYWGQQIAFKDIVKSGALAKKSDGNYGQSGGFTMGWDNCSNTPVSSRCVLLLALLNILCDYLSIFLMWPRRQLSLTMVSPFPFIPGILTQPCIFRHLVPC